MRFNMIEYNEEYDSRLRTLVRENKYGCCGKLRKCKDLKYLDDYVFGCTRFLDETERRVGRKFANRAVRVFYVLNHIDRQLTCCVCGRPYVNSKELSAVERSKVDVGHLHCCHRCAMNDGRTQERIAAAFESRYGHRSCFQAESVRRKIEETNLRRYGTRQFSRSERYLEIGRENGWWPEAPEQKARRLESLKKTLAGRTEEEKHASAEKGRATTLRRYGVENWSQTRQSKSRYLDKDWSGRKKDREIATKRLRGTLNASKPEGAVHERLAVTFGRDDVVRQYRDPRYPFFCDFYVRSLDLFVECNFHWTHGLGLGFYDQDNPDHRALLRKWRQKADVDGKAFYRAAIYAWTDLDPRKARAAQAAGLRYLALWKPEEALSWLQSVDPAKMRLAVGGK